MPTHWPTTLVEGDVRRTCTIVDLSRSGARVKLLEPLARNSRIMLIDDRIGTLEGTVMWCHGNTAGVAFLPPAPEVAARLRQLLQALEEAEARRAAERARPRAVFGRRGL
jgi:hypothetical protein